MAVSQRDVLRAEWAVLRPWIDTIPSAAMDRPSVLEGWNVRQLLAHLAQGVTTVARVQPADPGSAVAHDGGSYVGTYPTVAAQVVEGARRGAAEHGHDLAGYLDGRWALMSESMEAWDDESVVVASRRGPIRLDELLRTRVVEAVVHGDDLARSVPEIEPPRHDRDALREVVGLLLGALVARAPGRSVEVRVPPFGVVQCVEGGSHTRGTPPNTVEADALTWIRVACGRVPWSDAVADGTLRASGTRSDLSAVPGLLPLL